MCMSIATKPSFFRFIAFTYCTVCKHVHVHVLYFTFAHALHMYTCPCMFRLCYVGIDQSNCMITDVFFFI